MAQRSPLRDTSETFGRGNASPVLSDQFRENTEISLIAPRRTGGTRFAMPLVLVRDEVTTTR